MSAFNTRGLIYATNCTPAALLALYVAFNAGLPNPGWASLTVFLVSQPLGAASGSVVSRAQARQGHAPQAAALLGALDDTIRQLLALSGGLRLKGLAAATGLRRGLFPSAPPFDDQGRATC